MSCEFFKLAELLLIDFAFFEFLDGHIVNYAMSRKETQKGRTHSCDGCVKINTNRTRI